MCMLVSLWRSSKRASWPQQSIWPQPTKPLHHPPHQLPHQPQSTTPTFTSTFTSSLPGITRCNHPKKFKDQLLLVSPPNWSISVIRFSLWLFYHQVPSTKGQSTAESLQNSGLMATPSYVCLFFLFFSFFLFLFSFSFFCPFFFFLHSRGHRPRPNKCRNQPMKDRLH